MGLTEDSTYGESFCHLHIPHPHPTSSVPPGFVWGSNMHFGGARLSALVSMRAWK